MAFTVFRRPAMSLRDSSLSPQICVILKGMLDNRPHASRCFNLGFDSQRPCPQSLGEESQLLSCFHFEILRTVALEGVGKRKFSLGTNVLLPCL